jgi:hypothetical protein
MIDDKDKENDAELIQNLSPIKNENPVLDQSQA